MNIGKVIPAAGALLAAVACAAIAVQAGARATATPAPATVGALKVTIREWDVPTPHARPHDPAVAPDGALWFTEQEANKLGRLDPATGTIREYALKTTHSGPHGLVADADGNIWYTGNYAALIGKLDPRTGDVTEYALPTDTARDPHSLAFDVKGTLWFTVQGGNAFGRLDPRTGKVEVKAVPTPHALPYGIAINSHGVPIFCEFGANHLAEIDPKTMALTEHKLPEGARPRRLAIAADDRVYYSDFARGYLARFDPATGEVKEWASPGGASSEPYGIAITQDGMVWYSEAGVHPNTVIRFDPKTETFARATIPSGGGVVRNMVATRDGRLYLACSGVNKVGIVEAQP
jgi:virginiamycin B lyase